MAFVSNLMLGRVEECLSVLLSTERYPEAAFFARSYCPSQVVSPEAFSGLEAGVT